MSICFAVKKDQLTGPGITARGRIRCRLDLNWKMVWKNEDNGAPLLSSRGFLCRHAIERFGRRATLRLKDIFRASHSPTKIALNIQFSDPCIQGVVSQKEEKNRPKSEPSFAIQSQLEMCRQLVAQVRLTNQPSPKAHWLSASPPHPPCRCSCSPWATTFTLLFSNLELLC